MGLGYLGGMKCRICRVREPDSREHVFLSALGGTWVVPNVLCTPCNSACGSGIDAELVAGLQDLRLLLGVVGDRDQTVSVEKVDEHGRRFIVGPGMVPRPAEGPPEILKEDGANKTVSLASERAARKYIQSFERKGQKFSVNAASIRSSYGGRVPMNFGFRDSEAALRSCLKTVLTLIIGAGQEGLPRAWEAAWRCVAGEGFETCGISIAFSASPPPVRGIEHGLGVVSHRVCARARPYRDAHLVEADVRLFGDIGVCMYIDGAARAPFNIGYGIDPLSKKSCRVDDWTGVVGVPDEVEYEALVQAVVAALQATVTFAEKRNAERGLTELIETAWNEAFEGVSPGSPMPPEAAMKMSRLVAERTVDQVLRLESSRPAPELLERLKGTSDPKKRA
jgi:hypothetical protein